MNCWATTLAILAVLSASLAVAEDFKTINGKIYKDATISRVEADGIVIRTKTGISKIYFVELPKDVQEHFHYDSAQGARFTTEREVTGARQNVTFGEHRLGATADQFVAQYGAPQDSPSLDKNSPLLQGAIHHTYDYKGWRIRAAFLPPNGPAVRMAFRMRRTNTNPASTTATASMPLYFALICERELTMISGFPW